MALEDNLRAEYILIQGQYEAFDQRALSLKALATPLLGAGIAFGFKEASVAVLLATVLVATSLWILEGIWKTFQYCFAARIMQLEMWFRDPQSAEPSPFQIYTEWTRSWTTHFGRLNSLPAILKQPFVFLPYLPIVAFGLAGVGWSLSERIPG